MITNGILLLFASIPLALVAILPTSAGFPVQVDNAVSSVASFLHILDPIVPTNDLVNALLYVVLPVEIAIFTYWSTNKILGFIRGN